MWESTSFSSSSIIGPFSCSDSPSLLVPPGDQIITRPLIEGTTAIQFGVVFPYPSSLCRDERVRYSPVEVRQCRSIAGVLGDCELIALVSISGQSLVSILLDSVILVSHRVWELCG